MKSIARMCCLLLWLAPSVLIAGKPVDSLSTPSINAISIRIEDFQYGAGFYVTHWFEREFALRGGLAGHYSSFEFQTYSSQLGTGTAIHEELAISPTAAVLYRFLTRQNVAAYLGVETRLTWFIKNDGSGKYTVLKPSVVFGVEAFVTDYLSISGEQMLSTTFYLNDDRYKKYTLGEGFLAVSFYF
jgi:hypothetical protein